LNNKIATESIYLTNSLFMQLQLKVPNMVCAACAATITKAVMAIAPIAKVEADPTTKLVSIDTSQSEVAIKQTLAAAGYPVT